MASKNKLVDQTSTKALNRLENSSLLANLEHILLQNEQYKRELSAEKEKKRRVEESHNQIIKSRSLELDNNQQREAGGGSNKDSIGLKLQIEDLQREISRLKKSEREAKLQLSTVGESTDKLLSDMEELRNQLEICKADLKIERALKKSYEANAKKADEEAAEYKASLELIERQVDEKKRKCDSDRLMLQLKHDAEIEELNRVHSSEIDELKEKLKRVSKG